MKQGQFKNSLHLGTGNIEGEAAALWPGKSGSKAKTEAKNSLQVDVDIWG